MFVCFYVSCWSRLILCLFVNYVSCYFHFLFFVGFMSIFRLMFFFFFFYLKQKTPYEMRFSDWSSDVCSSDLTFPHHARQPAPQDAARPDRADIFQAAHRAIHLRLCRPQGDAARRGGAKDRREHQGRDALQQAVRRRHDVTDDRRRGRDGGGARGRPLPDRPGGAARRFARTLRLDAVRSEEHTSELQSLMRISYAVFCLEKKTVIDSIVELQESLYT